MGGAILKRFQEVRRALLSLRTFYKVAGIGVLVSCIFGLVVYLQVMSSVYRLTYESLASSVVLTARDLALALEDPLLTEDILSVREILDDESRSIPDFLSAAVYDSQLQLRAQSGERPPVEGPIEDLPDDGALEVFEIEDVWVFRASYPIREGRLGSLALEVTDASPRSDLAEIRRVILISLLLCSAIGIALAAWLSRVLTRPLEHLVDATGQVEAGNFDVEARIESSDEVGTLSLAFNRMARSLRRYRNEVEENARLKRTLLEKVVRVQEKERRQFARELHDELGQSLTAALLHLRSNCDYNGPQGSLCNNVEGQLLALIDKVHSLAWGIRPPVLEDCGLDCAVKEYLAETARKSGIQIDFHGDDLAGERRLPEDLELAVYRVSQEAVLNVVKHANAKRASVLLFKRNQTLTLLVEDDGCGFDPGRAGEGPLHLGIIGMKERIASCGGVLSIESSPGKGCTVQARVPIG